MFFSLFYAKGICKINVGIQRLIKATWLRHRSQNSQYALFVS